MNGAATRGTRRQLRDGQKAGVQAYGMPTDGMRMGGIRLSSLFLSLLLTVRHGRPLRHPRAMERQEDGVLVVVLVAVGAEDIIETTCGPTRSCAMGRRSMCNSIGVASNESRRRDGNSDSFRLRE